MSVTAGVAHDHRVAPLAGPRLLAGTDTQVWVGLTSHRRLHGPVLGTSPKTLLESLDRVGLRGRGGAAFPVARKLEAVLGRARCAVVVNGNEGEPGSWKDRTLMRRCPHLVLDGAAVVAAALQAERVVVAVGDPESAMSLGRAVQERGDQVEIVHTAGSFVGGEARALLNGVAGRSPVPNGRRTLPTRSGLEGRPTFVSNVETYAQIAVLLALGSADFASVGVAHEPGTTLLTLVGDVPAAGSVVEVATGTPLGAILPQVTDWPAPVLFGGYHGTWVRASSGLRVDRTSVALGAGMIGRLPVDTCPLGEISRATDWLASRSTGQCGPCWFGLPALAADLRALAAGEQSAIGRLRHRLDGLPGRGACSHPDGTARFVASALAAFPDEVAHHAATGRCGRHVIGALPIDGRGGR